MLKSQKEWSSLKLIDRKIIMAVLFDGSPKIAQRNLGIANRLFYSRWKQLKPTYSYLLSVIPNKVVNNLKNYGKMTSA